ncbi:MAG: hypothetical protein PVF83_06935 [Anaerolineales bacterium]|jgi:hypothetical protein
MGDTTWIETIYWGATIIGGTLFILRTILLLVGGGVDHDDFDLHVEGDLHVEHDLQFDADYTDTYSDSDFDFKLLSMQGLTGFFMLFGLVGLALLKANFAILITIMGGGLAGLFAVWVISVVFSQLKRLQSDGTVNIKNAIGQNGSVYLVIPPKGSGQVQVPVQGALRIFDAVSKDGKNIKTGKKVRVTGIVDNKTLVVEEI